MYLIWCWQVYPVQVFVAGQYPAYESLVDFVLRYEDVRDNGRVEYQMEWP